MKKVFTLVLAVVATLLFVLPASASDHKKNKKDDCEFLQKLANNSLLWNLIGSTAQTNTTNFALLPGQLSQTNSTNAAIQALGNLLATNHAPIFSNASSLQLRK